MRTIERQVEEERLIASALDEVDRRGREDVAAIAGVLLRLTVLEQDRIVIVASSRQVGGLTDPASLQNEGFLKAPVDGPQGEVVSQVPLAEDARAISGAGEPLGQGHLGGMHERAAEIGVDDSRPVVVPSREQAGARGRADGRDVRSA